MKYKIIHNPRCSKSRKWIEFLKEKWLDFEIIKYIKYPLNKEEIEDISKKLWKNPIDFCRTWEAVFKELWLKKDSKNKQIISAMVRNPKLIERPILIFWEKAVVWRPDPIEAFEEFLG